MQREVASTSSPLSVTAFSILAPPGAREASWELHHWHELDFASFRAEVKREFHHDIRLTERGEWEIPI